MLVPSLLTAYIGGDKTLLITCHDGELAFPANYRGRVFRYSSDSTVLHKYDLLQEESLRYYVDEKKCTQIILALSNHPQIIQYLLQDYAMESLRASLQFNENIIIDDVVMHKVLLEMHLVQQGKILMDYNFIEEKVRLRRLKVIGIMMPTPLQDERITTIFQNGISFNNTISSN